jgi:tetratricopeptide (TPR) repeat protein
VSIATESLQEIHGLYEQGLYLQAYEASKALGPLTEWRGTAARVLAGRMASNLGAIRLGRVLHRLAYRDDAEHDEAKFYYVLAVLTRRGPWYALKQFDHIDLSSEADAELQGAWHMLHCYLFALFRDFSESDRAFQRACDVAEHTSWVWVQWSDVLEMQDRHEESLDAALKALELRPWYRPAVQVAGHSLVQSNRENEALQLLTDALQHNESGDLIAQLAGLQMELEMYDESRRNFDRLDGFYPLLSYEKERGKWLAARRADAAYYCGDYDAAIEWAEKSESEFHKGIAERLRAEPREARRVELPVGFVRQHHVTCSPATISALCEYFGQPSNHLEMVEEICYDGTPAHNERRWAQERGLIAREFRVTLESAMQLIDAGIPFTLTTVEPGNAHLQAVIGYDQLRGTLLVRDPSQRLHGEFRTEEMLKHYASTGPRGMVLVPPEKAAALQDIELPEASNYDDYFQIEDALHSHDRARAQTVFEQMRERDPSHRLTLYGGRALAAYDANPVKTLEMVEALLAQYPDDVNLRLAKLDSLKAIGRRQQRIDLLKDACGKKDADPLFMIEYGRELIDDFREIDSVVWILRTVLRQRATSGAVYDLMAQVRWRQQQRELGTRLYRIAACLDDKNEGAAQSYFMATRYLKKANETIDWLKDRSERYQRQSGIPAQTLCWAYEQLDQPMRGLEVLESALADRPDDGELMTYAAGVFLRCGNEQRAEELIEQAKGNSVRAIWLRAAASLAASRSDLQASLNCWQEVLELEPNALDANRMIADLLAAVRDEDAAVQHVQQMVERFPHNYHIRQLRIEWSANETPKVTEGAVRSLLETYANDPWARRELAIALIGQKRLDEALREAELAAQLEPDNSVCFTIIGKIYEAQGRIGAAQAMYRRSIEISVDYDAAIDALMAVCDTKQDRIEALEFIAEQLTRQVTFGEGLWLFRYYADATLEPDEVLRILRDAHAERPDLWHSWMALTQQLISTVKLYEAQEVAVRAVDRFPLLPRLWLQLAAVYEKGEKWDKEIEAIETALELSPGWGDAERQLAAAHRRGNNLQQAEDVLRRAIRFDPRDCLNHSMLAEVLWAKGDRERAIDSIKRAVILEPGHQAAWDLLRDWSIEIEQATLAVDAARALTEARPTQARSWLVLAEVLQPQQKYDEYLAALDEALTCNPRNTEAYSNKAICYAEQGNFEQALAACRPAIFNDRLPVQLRAREAQIHAFSGDYQQAIGIMKSVLEDDPDYVWAWSQLADWYADTGEHDKFLHASEQLMRVAPKLAVSHGYMGDALMQQGKRDEAIKEFHDAIRLEPSYFYAARYLMELYLEDNNPSAAEQVLADTRAEMPPGYDLAYDVRLAVAKARRNEVVDNLVALCGTLRDDSEPFFTAIRGIESLHMDGKLAHALQEGVSSQAYPADVVHSWARFAVKSSNNKHVTAMLKAFKQRDNHWAFLAGGYIDGLLEAEQGEVANKFIRKHRADLRAHDVTWRIAGEALSDLNLRKQAAEWLADWPQRSNATGRTLFCMAVSLRILRRDAEARAVSEAALQMPADHVLPFHRLWIATDLAIDGDGSNALVMLADISDDQLNDYYQALHRMICALVDGLQPATSRDPYGQAKYKLQLSYSGGDKLLTRIQRQCRARLAAHHGRSLTAMFLRLLSQL